MGRVLEPRWVEGTVLGKPVPGFEHKPSSAVLAMGFDLVFLQHAKGLTREIRPHDLLRIEDVSQLVARQAVEISEIGVEFGPQQRASFGNPSERRAVIAKIPRQRLHRLGCVDKLDYPGRYESNAI